MNFHDFGNITTITNKMTSGYGFQQRRKPQKYRINYYILPMLPNYLIKRKNK